MHNRVQRALARRERMRRSRDYAWTVFAASAVAAAFGWILLVDHVLSGLRTQWWIVLIYAAIGAVSSYVAIRALAAARRLARRFDEAQPLEILEDAPERSRSVWNEILGRRR